MRSWIFINFLLLLLVIGSCEPKKSGIKVKKEKNLTPQQNISTRRCPNSYVCVNRRCRSRSQTNFRRGSHYFGGGKAIKGSRNLSYTCGTRNLVVWYVNQKNWKYLSLSWIWDEDIIKFVSQNNLSFCHSKRGNICWWNDMNLLFIVSNGHYEIFTEITNFLWCPILIRSRSYRFNQKYIFVFVFALPLNNFSRNIRNDRQTLHSAKSGSASS